MTHNIHASLANLVVEIASLTPDPRNARQHDERNLKAVEDSFREHGQVKPIVVQRLSDNGRPMVIRAGNASTEVASRMGWSHIAAVVLDVKDKEAKSYALRDNRTADLAEWDLPNLGAEMRELKDLGVDVASLGWEPFEYEPLMEAEWKPPGNTGEDFDVPGKGTSIKFTEEQMESMQAAVGGKKVTAESIVTRLTLSLAGPG
jgi:hypothetical protein